MCRPQARVTALTCQWLMGKCTVNSVDLPDGASCQSGVIRSTPLPVSKAMKSVSKSSGPEMGAVDPHYDAMICNTGLCGEMQVFGGEQVRRDLRQYL